jgi:hypothetical protein
MRYIAYLMVGATLLLAACGAAPTGSAAPTQPAAPTNAPAQPAAPTAGATQPPEAVAASAPASTAAPAENSVEQVEPSEGDKVLPEGDMNGVLVIFKRSGGIAGLDQTLTIYEDGRTTFVGGKSEGAAQVAATDLSELRRLLASPEFTALDARYPARGADQFIYSITTQAGGKTQTVVTMDGAKKPEILNQVLAELGKMLQAQAQ